MTDELDTSAAARRLAAELRSASLPLARASLRDRVASIPEETSIAGRSQQQRSWA